jgi:uncharacterized membrane protein YccC
LNDLVRKALRVGLSSYVTNGMSGALGLLVISSAIHAVIGPAAAAAATVGVLIAAPPDQVGPKHGKFTQMLPAALIGTPLFIAVQLLRESPGPLWLLLVTFTFLAFLGSAWGKRGFPISMSVMFSMIFALAAQPPANVHAALQATTWFALGAALYILWATAVNALLNRRYRALVLVDTLFSVATLMRSQGVHFLTAPGARDALVVGRLMRQQAALADQLQSARNMLLEAPRTARRLQLAGMLMQILDMRDHLVACALDLDTLRARPEQHELLAVLATEIQALAADLEELADAMLLGRMPPPFRRERPAQAVAAASTDLPTVDVHQPAPHVLAASLARRVGHVHEEVQRVIAIARREREPDVEVVRTAWKLFISPTTWTWRPFLTLWRWDAPPLRHAIRAALAIGAGQALGYALPWGSHEYWILLSITVVLRGSLAQTLERRNNRVAGTLLGCLVAGALLAARLPAAVLLLVVAAGQGIAHAFAIRRYLVTAVAASVLALVQAHLLNAVGSPVFQAVERVTDTLIGVTIAWIFSYVLPSWERTQIASLVARTLAAQKRHAELALGLGQLHAIDGDAELGWRLARREAYDSLSALVQAIQRALAEPRAVRPRLDALERMLGHSYQLLAQLTAIKTMLLQRRDRLDIAQLQQPLSESSSAIAAALAGTAIAPTLPRLHTDAPPMLELPDPREHDLSPWLLRRLHLAVDLARDLKSEATQALEAPAAAPS